MLTHQLNRQRRASKIIELVRSIGIGLLTVIMVLSAFGYLLFIKMHIPQTRNQRSLQMQMTPEQMMSMLNPAMGIPLTPQLPLTPEQMLLQQQCIEAQLAQFQQLHLQSQISQQQLHTQQLQYQQCMASSHPIFPVSAVSTAQSRPASPQQPAAKPEEAPTQNQYQSPNVGQTPKMITCDKGILTWHEGRLPRYHKSAIKQMKPSEVLKGLDYWQFWEPRLSHFPSWMRVQLESFRERAGKAFPVGGGAIHPVSGKGPNAARQQKLPRTSQEGAESPSLPDLSAMEDDALENIDIIRKNAKLILKNEDGEEDTWRVLKTPTGAPGQKEYEMQIELLSEKGDQSGEPRIFSEDQLKALLKLEGNRIELDQWSLL